MKNQITATSEQIKAFSRVETARNLMADMYVGVPADQHVIG